MSDHGFVVLTTIFRKEGDKVTAECRQLGTATFGRTLDEADRKLQEAIELHLNTLEELGEQERFFREHNIPFYPDYPRDAFVSFFDVASAPGIFTKVHIHPLKPAKAG